MHRLSDLDYMELAFIEGRKSRLIAPPNPWVGCLIVQNGEIVGRGSSQPAGGAHAEIEALKRAGPKAAGATAYITLEPCSHHGRTPPCTQALIQSKLKRIVIAIEDPDTNVNGSGIKHLQHAGLNVEIGVGKEIAQREFAPYLTHRTTGLPYCVLKTAMSLDGRICSPDGTSQWITGKRSRRDGHILRAESQAVIVGSGTAIHDLPALTPRDIEGSDHPPLRVLLDGRGRTKVNGPLFDTSLGPVLIYTTPQSDQNTVTHWKKRGCEVVEVMPSSLGEGVHLPQVLKDLGKRGVIQALFEGGAKLNSQALQLGCVDQICLYIGNCFIGNGTPAFTLDRIPTIEKAKRWHLDRAETLGETVKLTYLRLE